MSTNQKRETIFLGSSDPSTPNLHDSISPPFIKPPFPPNIDPYKLISDRRQDNNFGRMPTRTPNAFILYRKIFIETAHKEGYHLPMTVISSLASKSWKHEPDTVKDEYKRISKQIFEIRKRLFPKPERKTKKDKWNFVSFSKRSNLNDDSNNIEMKISNYQDNEDNIVQQENHESSSNNVNDNTNLVHDSYVDNKNDELFHSNSDNIYDINQQTYPNSDISLMRSSHFQSYM